MSRLGPNCPSLALGLFAAAFLLVGEAAAHDVWLEATSHERGDRTIFAGERVDVRLLVGHGSDDAEPVARNDGLILEFAARNPSGIEQSVPGLHGMDPAGIFRPDRPGLWSLAYVGRPREHRLDAAFFEDYLLEEGLDWVSNRRRGEGQSSAPGRELYSRVLQNLVPVCGTSALAKVPVRHGVAVDEKKLPVRFLLTHDDRFARLRLVADGEGVAGALVDLRRDGRYVASVRTDDDGRLRLRPEAGSWVATAVVMEAMNHPRADWRTYFTALTFFWPPRACP